MFLNMCHNFSIFSEKKKKRFLSWQATRELGNPYKSLWKKVPNFEQQMSIYVWCDTNFNLSAQMHFPTLSIKVFWSLGDTMHQICTNLYQSAFDKIHRSSDFINNFKEFKNWKNPHLIRGDVRKLSWFSYREHQCKSYLKENWFVNTQCQTNC